MITRPPSLPGRERGYMILLVLVALVAMTVSGIALIRSMDTNQLLAGNMAAHNATIHSADIGVQTAVAWIQANSGNVNADNPGAGYYAEEQEPSWESSALWSACGGCTLPADAAGNSVSWLVHRMCTTAGSPNAGGLQFCASNTGGGTGSGNSQQTSGYPFKGTPKSLYRITVQVVGPRNTSSLSQAFILM